MVGANTNVETIKVSEGIGFGGDAPLMMNIASFDVSSVDNKKRGVGFVQAKVRLVSNFYRGVGLVNSLASRVLIDRNGGLVTFVTPSVGVGSGVGAFVRVFPMATSFDEISDWGFNIGYSYSYKGKWMAFEGNAAIGKQDYKLGLTLGIKYLLGIGALGYADISNTIIHQKINYLEASMIDITKYVNSTIPNSYCIVDDVMNLFYEAYKLIPSK
jgi:hypothetical protein